MPNPSRGEVEFVLGNKTYVVRPSFQLLRELENALGPLLSLGEKFQKREFGFTEVVRFVFICVRRLDRRLTEDKVGEMLLDVGISAVFDPIASFVTNALNPPREDDSDKDDAKVIEGNVVTN